MMCRRSSRLVEIVADADRQVLLRFSGGIEIRLAVSMDLTAALQELQALGVATKPSRSLWRLGSTVTPAGKSLILVLFMNGCCANLLTASVCHRGSVSAYFQRSFLMTMGARVYCMHHEFML